MSVQPWIARWISSNLWTRDLSTLALATRLKIRLLRFLIVALEEFRRDQLTLRAMGLVYTSLLSLVPFLAVTFSVLKAFGAHQALEPTLIRALQPLGPQGAALTQHVIAFVNNLQVGVLGAVGLGGLFFTIISLLGQVEDALNQIWGGQSARPLSRKFTDYLSVILVGPVLVFSAFALTASAQSYWLVQWVLEKTTLEWVIIALTRVTPFFLLCTAFTFFYKFLPCARVHFSAALVGGATAGLLWQTAGVGFSLFLTNSARYTAIYSGFAVVVLFLIWLYVGWLVVLIGGEVAYLYQRGVTTLGRTLRIQRGGVYRLRLALLLFAAIARRLLAHQPPWQEQELAASLHAEPRELEELIDESIQRGLLFRSAEPEGVVLARLPEHITIPDIFDLIDYPETPELDALLQGDDPATAVLRRRDQTVRQAFADFTLRKLAAEAQMADLPSTCALAADHAQQQRTEKASSL